MTNMRTRGRRLVIIDPPPPAPCCAAGGAIAYAISVNIVTSKGQQGILSP